MNRTNSSHARERGVVLGLAFLFCANVHSQDSALREIVHRLFRQQSYILVESPSEPARLILLNSGSTPAHLSADDLILRQVLIDLSSVDSDVREDAVLALADIDARGAIDILNSALTDPSPQVRDTAAAVLEDVSRAE